VKDGLDSLLQGAVDAAVRKDSRPILFLLL
jgi:hypothetical protein